MVDNRESVPALRYPRVVDGLTSVRLGGPGSPSIVQGPGSKRHFRVSAGTLATITAMDGTRSVQQLSTMLGVSTTRLENLIDHLDDLGLLVGTSDSGVHRLPYGVADRGLPRWLQRIIYVNLPVVFPDRLIELAYRRLRLNRFFGAPGLTLFLLAGLGGLGVVTFRPEVVAEGVRAGLDPQWYWLVLTILAVKRPVHELGHAFACRHYGQPVGGLGLAVYYFLPALYVDASSAWMLPSRRSRIWVHLAGFLADLSVLFAALLVAVAFPSFTAPKVAAGILLVVVAASVAFVLNPMLKLDGYFILCDLLGTTNLRERAFGALFTMVRTLLTKLGVRVAGGAYGTDRTARGIGLVGYALAALIYTGGILLWAARRLSSWLQDNWSPDPPLPVIPYAMAVSIFGAFLYFTWRASVTSSHRRF